jgi:glycosyltransferase involved in cell wall biosynthesis
MLSKGALEIKPLKKKLFLLAAKVLGLFKNLVWHASTEIEEKEIINVFGPDVKIQLAIDLAPSASANHPIKIKIVNEADFFYLGRISPVKNLLKCITMLSHIKDPYRINFHIFGPVEDELYWESCQAEVKKCGNNINTEYRGPVNHEELTGLLSHYHFLLLLTENENYGHAIIESMALGCPVIISNRTPWRNLENMKAGWDLELNDTTSIVNRIQSATAMDQLTYESWSAGAYNMAQRVINNEKSVEDNKALFR